MSRSAPTYDGPPPAGYIPGRGRGASGFTTRSDIGNASGPPKPPPDQSQYDKFSGFKEEGLFDSGEYNEEDREADDVYASIDEKISQRTKRRREQKEENELLSNKRLDASGLLFSSGKISDQFKDVNFIINLKDGYSI